MSSVTDNQKYKKAMSTVKNIKALESLLKEEGYTMRRQNGSHGIFRNDERGISVSVKMNEVTRGTLRNILQQVYPSWNVKPIAEDSTVQEEVKPEFELNESMLALAFELNLDVENITEEDYNTLAELIEA